MRQLLSLFVALATSAAAFADVEITREEAGTIKSYDLEEFGAQRTNLVGQIVKLKFNSRLADSPKNPDGTLSGQLRLFSTGGSTFKYGYLRVTVPQAGVDWFMKIPTGEKRSSIVVFARVTPGDRFTPVELLGREIKTDLKGSRIVW